LLGNALLGESGEDFAEDVVYVCDGVKSSGKGSELGGKLVGFEKLLLFAGVKDVERGMAFLAGRAAGACIQDLRKGELLT
jgi:hypothetical protein